MGKYYTMTLLMKTGLLFIIKPIAARTRCSIMEALYWYNVTPKDDAMASTAPANAIYNYRIRVKDIDTAPPLEHVDSGPYNAVDAVWVKTPHSLCLTQFEKGMVTGIYSPHSVLINGIPRQIRDLRPRHRSVTLEDDGGNSSPESDSSTPLLYGTESSDSSAELEKQSRTMMKPRTREAHWTQLWKRYVNLFQFYAEAVVEDGCHLHAIYVIVRSGRSVEEKWIHPWKKRARVCLACKSKNGRSNVVF